MLIKIHIFWGKRDRQQHSEGVISGVQPPITNAAMLKKNSRDLNRRLGL